MEDYKKQLEEYETHIVELQETIDELTYDSICWYLLTKSIEEFRSREHLEETLEDFVSSLEALVTGITDTVKETLEE